MSEEQDWKAVADFTGCAKMFGAQGRAPEIFEMIEGLQHTITAMLKDSMQDDLIETGTHKSVTSVIATLLRRCERNP